MKKILLLSLLSVVGLSILGSDRGRALYPFEGREDLPTEDFEERPFDYEAADIFGPAWEDETDTQVWSQVPEGVVDNVLSFLSPEDAHGFGGASKQSNADFNRSTRFERAVQIAWPITLERDVCDMTTLSDGTIALLKDSEIEIIDPFSLKTVRVLRLDGPCLYLKRLGKDRLVASPLGYRSENTFVLDLGGAEGDEVVDVVPNAYGDFIPLDESRVAYLLRYGIKVFNLLDTGFVREKEVTHSYIVPMCLCQLSSGEVVLGGSHGGIFIIDLVGSTQRTIKARGPGAQDRVVALSGRRFASIDRVEGVRIWDLSQGEGGEYLHTLNHGTGITGLCLLPSGKIASGSVGGIISISDPMKPNGKVRILEGHSKPVFGFCLLLDDRLVSHSSDKTVKIWPSKKYFEVKVKRTQDPRDYEIDGPGIYDILFGKGAEANRESTRLVDAVLQAENRDQMKVAFKEWMELNFAFVDEELQLNNELDPNLLRQVETVFTAVKDSKIKHLMRQKVELFEGEDTISFWMKKLKTLKGRLAVELEDQQRLAAEQVALQEEESSDSEDDDAPTLEDVRRLANALPQLRRDAQQEERSNRMNAFLTEDSSGVRRLATLTEEDIIPDSFKGEEEGPYADLPALGVLSDDDEDDGMDDDSMENVD